MQHRPTGRIDEAFRDIELRSMRKLVQALPHRGLDAGVNVIGGDNEEEVEPAFALKCAFFLAHGTTGALRQRHVPAGTSLTPEIDITFES
ncbi:MAG: hypothetical protein R3C97_12555 [Geminicoccaceae bacterium]